MSNKLGEELERLDKITRVGTEEYKFVMAVLSVIILKKKFILEDIQKAEYIQELNAELDTNNPIVDFIAGMDLDHQNLTIQEISKYLYIKHIDGK